MVLVIVAEQVWASPQRTPFSRLRRAIIFGSAVVFLVEASVYAATLYRTIPPPPTPAPPALAVIAPDAVATTVVGHLPHYTDRLTGQHQEPVSLILVGTHAQLERAFRTPRGRTRRVRRFHELLCYSQLEWVQGMCALVGVPLPSEDECLALAADATVALAPRVQTRVALTYAATLAVGLAAQQAGRSDLLRSPTRALAHDWQGLSLRVRKRPHDTERDGRPVRTLRVPRPVARDIRGRWGSRS